MEENKIIDNQESNDMKLEDINSNDNRNKVKKNKTYDKRRIIIIIFTIILCVVITTLVIFIKINKLNKTKIDTSESDDSNIEEIGINNERPSKVEPDDLNYAINSLSDKYNENDLKIEEIVDGNIRYVQISGLKNITIQNNINNEIKSLVYDLSYKNADYILRAVIRASFSNVLSVEILGEENIGLNYDLTTGEKITIDKLFISSAPIGTIISDLAYQAYAKSKADFNSMPVADMLNADLSEFEEDVINIISKYNENKESIKFSFSVAELDFYGENGSIGTINLVDYKDYIAIFKRYVGEDIFIDNNIGVKNIFVFTDSINRYAGLKGGKRSDEVFAYGKINDNFFVDIGDLPVKPTIEIESNAYKKIRDDVKSKINNIFNERKEKSLADKNKGYIFQSLSPYIDIKENSKIVSVIFDFSEIELDKELFDNNLSELLIRAYKYSLTYPAVDGVFLGNILSVSGPYNDKVLNRNGDTMIWYYNVEDGNYLSDNEELARRYAKTTSDLEKDLNDYFTDKYLIYGMVQKINFTRFENGISTSIDEKLISDYYGKKNYIEFISTFLNKVKELTESIDLRTTKEEFLKFENSDNRYDISSNHYQFQIKWDSLRKENIYILAESKEFGLDIVYNIKLKSNGEKIFSDLFDKYNK